MGFRGGTVSCPGASLGRGSLAMPCWGSRDLPWERCQQISLGKPGPP